MTRHAVAFCLALLITLPKAIHAQAPASTASTAPDPAPASTTPAASSAASGVTLVPADMFYLRDASRTPMRHLASGTTVTVLSRDGAWFLVVYTDPRFGEERGYMRASDLRLERGAVEAQNRRGLSQRGFVEALGQAYPQTNASDTVRLIGDALWREDVQWKPRKFLQFAAGFDMRGDTHDQVDTDWRPDLNDRGIQRPLFGTRRLTATVTAGRFSLDVGKQFVRWGKADVLNPTDRFAPRDYLNVVDSQVLPVWAGRASLQLGEENFEVVYVPQLTPSRMPLLTQRWTVLPSAADGLSIVDGGAVFPDRGEEGVRWNHVGTSFETSLSFFDGFNHLPDLDAQIDASAVEITRTFPRLQTYGADVAVPTRFVSIKAEGALFHSPTGSSDEYVLYVMEIERQQGEWLFDLGYAGEHVIEDRHELAFSPERGLARSFVGRAAYAIGPQRNLTFEALVRRDAKGAYLKGEYSEGIGPHWRATLSASALGGKDGDFIGQYRRNGQLSGGLRFSF